MNSPTHLMAGAATAQVAMLVLGQNTRRSVQVAVGAGCFIAAMGTHLGLDLVPHYNWIIYVNWLNRVPYGWLLREAFFSVPAIVLALWCGRDHPVLNFMGLFGSMYPDFEKVAYLDFHLPARFVLFPYHSMRCTAYNWNVPISTLMTREFVIFFTLAAITIGVSLWRQRKTPLTPDEEAPQFA